MPPSGIWRSLTARDAPGPGTWRCRDVCVQLLVPPAHPHAPTPGLGTSTAKAARLIVARRGTIGSAGAPAAARSFSRNLLE
jgi:hypothetical protein